MPSISLGIGEAFLKGSRALCTNNYNIFNQKKKANPQSNSYIYKSNDVNSPATKNLGNKFFAGT